MKTSKGGAIVNISSIAGENKNKRMCSCGASKAAVNHLIRNMVFDLGPDNIRVNAIAPGAIRTAAFETVLTPEVEKTMLQHTPLGRLGEGTDVAAAADCRRPFPLRFPPLSLTHISGSEHQMSQQPCRE